MSEIMVPWLPSANHFRVICRLGVQRNDTVGDDDSIPNLMTQGGTVEIKANVTKFRYTESDGRKRIVFMPNDEPYRIQVGSGELFDVDGNMYVNLLDTTSPGVDPQGFSYKATVRPTVGEPFTVDIPGSVPSGVFDLADEVEVAASTGTPTINMRVTELERVVSEGLPSGGTVSWDYITGKPTFGTAAATDSTAYATAAQGVLAEATLAAAIPKTLVDAKGDLLAGTGDDVISRLAVGTNGALLMADSNAASGLSYQSPSPLLVNLLANSDFSNGTTGWTAPFSGSVSNVGNALVNTANDGVTVFYVNGALAVSAIAGHVYYGRAVVTPFRSHAPLFAIGGWYPSASVTASAGVATAVSFRTTAVSVSSHLALYANGGVATGQSAGSQTTFDNVVCIDLTACFGAGKEPSKAEMDAIMETWGGWFAKETPKLLPSYDWLKRTQNASTNLVQNGDFSNGTTGWGSVNGTIGAASGALVITGDGTGTTPAANATPQNFPSGDKWYCAASVRVTNASATTMRTRFIAGYLDVDQASPVSGTWYAQSGTLTIASSITAAAIVVTATYADAATSSGKSQEVKNPLVINLTKIFGAGLEPTKTEMDVLLSRYPNSWFNGTVNDLQRFYNPLNRVGKGSPYNVVTPRQKGETWTDLDQTNGAYKWLATGTMTTSWVVVDGDTGWRDVSSLLTTGWVLHSGSIGMMRLRRIGNVVYRAIFIDVSATAEFIGATRAAKRTVMVDPSGFGASLAYGQIGSLQLNNYMTGMVIRSASSSAVEVVTDGGGNWAAGDVLGGNISHITESPWPTTLPGTPA